MPLTVLKCNYIKCKPKVLAYRCFKNFDKVVFRHDLANALNDDVNNITYHAFEDTYLRILNNHAPLKQKYIRGNDQPFMNKTMRKAIMFRTKLRNIYLRNPIVENGMMFRKQRNYCVKLLKQTKISYYEHININLVTDNRKFWKCIKPSFSDKITTSYNYILYDNTEIIRNDREVADKFNSYFSNIALSLDIKDSSNYSSDSDDLSNPILTAIMNYSEHPSIVAVKQNCLSDVMHSSSILSQQDILKVVYDIDASKATASHNIPSRIFKENIDLYIDIITNIFNQGTIECNFPSRLKLADITPAHKKVTSLIKVTTNPLAFCLPYQNFLRSYMLHKSVHIWKSTFLNTCVVLEKD